MLQMTEFKRVIKQGVSAIVAEVLVIAVSLIIVSLAITWVMGFWHTTQETFMINPIIQVSYGSLSPEPVLKLHIVNKGNQADSITRVEIKAGSGFYINEAVFDIPAGFSGDIIIYEWSREGSPKPLTAGDRCRIYIYTIKHGLLIYDIVVSP